MPRRSNRALAKTDHFGLPVAVVAEKKSLYAKLSENYYKTKLPYPTKPKEPKTTVDLSKASDEEVAMVRAAMAKFKEEEVAYAARRNEYYEDEARLHAEFRADLEEENGMTGHPKADLLFSKAYDRGCSGGFDDVRSVYEDLVELVK